MKLTPKTKTVLEILLTSALILLIPLFFAIRAAAEKQAAQNAPAPAAPAAVNAPADSNAAKPQQPPACTFPLAQITAQEATPENYTFSEPQVVLTAPAGNLYKIAEWLPDNQQVLITEALLENYVNRNDNAPQQSIELYNSETSELRIYATRVQNDDLPTWSSDLKAVIYSAANYTKIDKRNRANEFTRQLWVSYGNPDTAQMLADDLTQFFFALKPGGEETLYLSDKQIVESHKVVSIEP